MDRQCDDDHQLGGQVTEAGQFRPRRPTVCAEPHPQCPSLARVRVGLGAATRTTVLMVLAASAAYVGFWALLRPASFFASFPGGGRSWLSGTGPYNEHLVRDVGALYMSLLVVTIACAIRPHPVWVRLTGVVWLVFSVPHLLYHASRLIPSGRGADQLAGLTGTVFLAGLLCLPVRRQR